MVKEQLARALALREQLDEALAGSKELGAKLREHGAELQALSAKLGEPAPAEGAANAELLVQALRGLEAWYREVNRGLFPRPRWAGWLAAGVFVLAAALGWVWLFPRAHFAIASKNYSADFRASLGADGRKGTEWLLPDGSTGWLEIPLDPPRSIKAVRLLNGYNNPHRDRGTQEFHVEAFQGEQQVAASSGRFPPLKGPPKWLELELKAEAVSRVRVSVDSFYGLGGGLAEVDVR